ncbi:hypothetical protein [Sphingomonas abaci]|uniref:Uncharacterized protein n=1 Tax=Sphingomonas abaci TaxID=237611 RepID=A0A7W7AK70_9SPHN|nr:hypothetical protein [Sphingomonas abaci]MBB4618535.1 hypothetical protein [Sphingomonas abaci]
MKILMAAALVSTAAAAHAQAPAKAYPSCNLTAQRALKGKVGGSITDPRQAHISVRANVLEADLSNARTARRLTQAMTSQLYNRVQAVRAGANRYTKSQGFLSADELASYDRALDAVATVLCRRVAPDWNAKIEGDSDYLQHRAVTLNTRIDAAIKGHRLSRQDAVPLRLAVGQVQTEAGHLQAVHGTIHRPDADRMNQRLTDVERALTHQP